MAKAREHAVRFSMLSIALLFFITSVGFTGLVIWQMQQEKKQQAINDALQQASQTATQGAQTTNKPEGTMLEGTTLSDFTPVNKVDSLRSEDLVAGSGNEVKPGDTITAHYTGALASNGTIFQSSHDRGEPFTSPLSNLIAGWQQGIPGMKEGGKRRLYIPAAQAYGSAEQPGIPANSDLVFDIELVRIGQ